MSAKSNRLQEPRSIWNIVSLEAFLVQPPVTRLKSHAFLMIVECGGLQIMALLINYRLV